MPERPKGAFRNPAFWLFIGLPMLAVSSLPYSAGDLASWTAIGNAILSSGKIALPQSMSVLPQQGSVFPSWGISVIYSWIFNWIGLNGLAILHHLIAAVIFAIIWKTQFEKSWSRLSIKSRWMAYAIWASLIPIMVERPSIIGLLFLVVSVHLIHRLRITRFSSWVPLILIQCLWVNTHGSFILLPVLLMWRGLFRSARVFMRGFTALFYRSVRTYGALIISLIAATFMNPFGIQVYGYIRKNSQLSKMRGITEWQPVSFYAEPPVGALYLLLALVTLIFVLRFLLQKPNLRTVLRKFGMPFWPLLLVGTTSIRMAPLPFLELPRVVRDQGRSPMKKPSWMLVSLVWSFVILLHTPVREWSANALGLQRLNLHSQEVPMKLIGAISGSSNPTCPVFTEMESAGAVLLYLKAPVFIHTQHIEFLDEDFHRFWQELNEPVDPKRYLNEYGSCHALIDLKRHSQFASLISKGQEWVEVLKEGEMALYERRSSP
jgi:hypothetical protein